MMNIMPPPMDAIVLSFLMSFLSTPRFSRFMKRIIPNTRPAIASIVWYPSVNPAVNGESAYCANGSLEEGVNIVIAPMKITAIRIRRIGQSIRPSVLLSFSGLRAMKKAGTKKRTE